MLGLVAVRYVVLGRVVIRSDELGYAFYAKFLYAGMGYDEQGYVRHFEFGCVEFR